MTRLSDRPNAVTRRNLDEAARHYNERALAGLLLAIATINVWNRLNVGTRQIAGDWLRSVEARKWVEKSHAVPR